MAEIELVASGLVDQKHEGDLPLRDPVLQLEASDHRIKAGVGVRDVEPLERLDLGVGRAEPTCQALEILKAPGERRLFLCRELVEFGNDALKPLEALGDRRHWLRDTRQRGMRNAL